MLTLFRNILFSRVGIIVTFLLFGVIILAFALGDATGLGGRKSAGSDGATLATIGGQKVSAAEMKIAVDRLRQQYPQVPIEEIIAKGGFDQPLDTKINGIAVEEFAKALGIRVGKDLIGSEIAAIPQFKGLDGKFDPALYRQILAQQQMTDAEANSEIGRTIINRMVFGPLVPQSLSKTPTPVNVATPYASMLLEKRTGTVAFIEASALPAGAPITDAEVADYYKKNIARFTVPERRSVQYAVVSPDDLKARAVPTDAELAKAYQDQHASFEATENRTLRQVVLLDQKSADALAAKVRGGTAIDAAAKSVGLEAATVTGVAKGAYAGQTSPAIADQVFAAAEGAVIGPVKSPLGWTVIHVDKIIKVPAKTLDQAKPDLLKSLSAQKLPVVANALREQLSEAIDAKTPIDQIAAKFKLTLQSTGLLDQQGVDPDAKTPPAQPDPKLGALMGLGFQATTQDDPQLLQVSQDGSFAIAKLEKIAPALPRPIASVSDQVKKEVLLERQVREARAVAQTVVDKVNKGAPLAKALADTGLKLQPTQPISATRKTLLNTKQPSQPLVLLFRMPVGTAKLLQAPNRAGWYVTVSDTVVRGDARGQKDEIDKMRAYLAGTASDEYSQQLIKAIRDSVGVKRNDAAINAMRAEFLGQSAPAGQ